jgi:hypothetical protein
MAEYKSAEEYIKSDKFKDFHKNRKLKLKENRAKLLSAKSKALRA